jgi:hypothetical protein
MKKILVLIGCSLALYSTACSQAKKEAPSLVEAVVNELSDDKYEGRKAGTFQNKLAALYIAEQYKRMGLQPVIDDEFLVPFLWEGDTLYNVVGKIEGDIDSFYALGAHFDHIGRDEQGPDFIFNGADDNASGVAAMIGVAAYFCRERPQKSMLFMAFNAEEVGLVGSTQLAEHQLPDSMLKKILVLFNLEMVGTIAASGKTTLFITGENQSNLMETMNYHAQSGLKIVKDPYPQLGLFFRSDNVAFFEKGIVAHSFSTCDMDNTDHYHQKHDDWHVINYDNLNRLTFGLSKTLEHMMKSKSVNLSNR